jgi:PEP-CTERM motif
VRVASSLVSKVDKHGWGLFMFKLGRFTSGFLALCAFILLPLVSRADILSENFNELTPALNATSVGAFTVTAGSVDVVGGALYGGLCVAPESGNCVDLDGSTGAAGQISSGNLTLAPGTYTLSFDLIGSQRGVTDSTTVTLGSLYDETFVLASGDDTTGIVSDTFTVTSTTDAQLIFTSNTPGNVGSLLDNVDLVATPEPATLSLMAIGLLGLLALRRFAIAK